MTAEALPDTSNRELALRVGRTYLLPRWKGLTFTEWVESDAYDPVAMKADFRANWWGTLLTERLVRRE